MLVPPLTYPGLLLMTGKAQVSGQQNEVTCAQLLLLCALHLCAHVCSQTGRVTDAWCCLRGPHSWGCSVGEVYYHMRLCT
jgi:hypothetical protein